MDQLAHAVYVSFFFVSMGRRLNSFHGPISYIDDGQKMLIHMISREHVLFFFLSCFGLNMSGETEAKVGSMGYRSDDLRLSI
jgi:hypothetical protein